jgi:hypothetical protein
MRIWLAHQAGLQAGQRIAHLAFDFGLGRERGDRVDHDQVHGAGAHQAVDDFQGLLAGVRLADQKIRQVDAQLLRVLHIQRVFGVDKGAGAGLALHLGDDLQREGGLARRFRAVDLDDAAARQAADAQRDVQAKRSGGDHLDVLELLALAQPHDRALAELLLDLGQRDLQRLALVAVRSADPRSLDLCIHENLLVNQ